jgi:hypothetical protein
MFRYRLHSPDGDDLGEATYAMVIKPGEEIHGNGGQRLRVVAVVQFDEEDESPFVGTTTGRGDVASPPRATSLRYRLRLGDAGRSARERVRKGHSDAP